MQCHGGQLLAYQCNMGGVVGRARASRPYCSISAFQELPARVELVLVRTSGCFTCMVRQSGRGIII